MAERPQWSTQSCLLHGGWEQEEESEKGKRWGQDTSLKSMLPVTYFHSPPPISPFSYKFLIGLIQ